MAPEDRRKTRDDDCGGHRLGTDALDGTVVDRIAQVVHIPHGAVFLPLLVGEVEVEEHDDAGLGIEPGERDDADPYGHAEVVTEEVDRPERADERERNRQKDDRGFDRGLRVGYLH